MEKLDCCPICESAAFDHKITCTDYTVSRETFNIVKCEHCEFKFTNPRPAQHEIGKYYESEDYISHSNTKKGVVNSLYQLVRKYTIGKKYALLRKYTDGNSILDYGCGTGEFLNYCTGKGMHTTGFEPDKGARDFGIKNYGLRITNEKELFEIKEPTFNVITMWHVLEHVHHLKELIGWLKKALKGSGVLIVAVPNHTSFDAERYAQYWAAYDVPRHLYHFSPKNISQLFADFDFKIIDVLPMKLDAFYVSMLSEKYKNGNSNLFSAFLTGLKSNIKASNKNHTWSSQIYVLRENGSK
ncbi:MAG: methyltransferase [Flavobacteriales bacterium]|nr:MAG: methyltransferase [Flavobacteriales bacterium]